MPYALRNHTGCTMWFATLTTTPTRWVTPATEQQRVRSGFRALCFRRVALSHSSSADSISEVHSQGADDTHNVSRWREVSPGDEVPFEFEAREKLRHRCGGGGGWCGVVLVGLRQAALPPQAHSRAEASPAAGPCVRVGAGEAGVGGQSGRVLPLRRCRPKQLVQHRESTTTMPWWCLLPNSGG